jgi:hypothetical protein
VSDLTDPLLVPKGLPLGTDVQRVAFVADRSDGRPVLLEFPAPVNRLAVLAADRPEKPLVGGRLSVLSVPVPAVDNPELVLRAREWVDAVALAGRPSQVVTLQGAQIVWAEGRAAVLAPADRLEGARRAVIEATYYDAELGDIERELAGLWPELEADTPLAFEFGERSLNDRRRLADRFRRLVALRARLARITPHVLCPHVHPPTLASQLGERLRERTRMAHRVEAADGQLAVFERVYEACGQRSSDFMLARTGHVLEWVIIILLLSQTVLLTVDLLARLRW